MMRQKKNVLYSKDKSNFKTEFAFYQVTMSAYSSPKIVTSGYDDRFIRFTTNYEVKVFGDTDFTVNFDDRWKADSFVKNVLGMQDEYEWEVSYHISGMRDARTASSITISAGQVSSIQAFLKLRNPTSYTDEAIDRFKLVLANHPIDDDVMKIVEWQLNECDRKNTEMFGHPNGQASSNE